MEAEEYVPLPKGDVHKKKEIVQDVTLHDLDVANARPQVFSCCLCVKSLQFPIKNEFLTFDLREGRTSFQ